MIVEGTVLILNVEDEYLFNYVIKRQCKIKQNVNCQSKNVIQLVTCKKCKKQEQGKQLALSHEWQIIDLASK